MNILLVDDEPFILEGLLALTRRETEYVDEAVGAQNGFEALDILENYHADILITDIHMPEMNGLELIRLARDKKLCDRFAILSGYDDFQYVREALRMNVLDYLLKPIDKQELKQLLQMAYLEHDQSDLGSDPSLQKGKEPLDKQLMGFIHAHFDQDLSLVELGEHVQLHPGYVSTLIKKITGTSFVHYLRDYRVEKAKDLLTSSPHLPIEHIADAVGYENHRYFYKVFKTVTGLTPSQYKEQFQ